MATSSSLLLQINDDYLTCQICMELYQSPKVLTCLHSFCKRCLDSCEKSEHESFIQCPLCRQSTTLGMKGVEGLKNNFVLSNMISMMVEWRRVHTRDEVVGDAPMCQTCPANESVMATYQCIECLDQLCADCAAFHSRTKLTRDHEIVSLEDVENGKYKEKIHQQEMSRCKKHKHFKTEHYCEDCDTVICKDCIIENHQGHSLSPIDAALKRVKEEVQTTQEHMETKMETSQQLLDDLIDIEDDQKSNFIKLESDINKFAEEIIQAVKEKRTELLEYIEKSHTEKLSQIAFMKDHLDSQIKCLNNCTQLSKCLLQSGTINEMMLLKKNMNETMEELTTATEKAAESSSTATNISEKMRFTPDDISTNKAVLGTIESEKDQKIFNFIETKLFKGKNENKEKLSPAKTLELEKGAVAKESKPCCSNENFKRELEDALYVAMPPEPRKPMPTPRARPRKSRSTLDLTSTKHLSLYLDDTELMATEQEQLYENLTPQHSKNIDFKTEVKTTNGSPAKPPRRSNYYPTAPHRRKLHSVATSVELDDQPQYDEIKRSISNQPARVAPAPPVKPNKLTNNYSPGKPKYHSPKKALKKAPAPLPPTISPKAGMLKAEIRKVFEISKRGSKDFYASLQGVVMTTNYIAILDSDGQQVFLFNTEGFYESRFQVHIPNQEKIKPTGLTISASGNIYVLYPSLVTVWTTGGILLTVFGHQQLTDAHGIAVDSQERVIVADEGKQDILIFTKRGNYVTNFKLSQSYLHCPRFICTTSRDEIVISDQQSNLVNIFDANGHLLTTCDSKAERKLKYPRGVTTIWPQKGQQEVLLIADQGHNRVSAYNLQGKFLYHVVELSNDNALKNPYYISALDNKKLVVLQNNSIQSRLYNLKTIVTS